jgi:branched-chain amino acid transport system ATP-binding protein
MFNLITGLIKPSGGTFFLNNQNYSPENIEQVVCYGIARTFQNIRLFNEMSVIQNVMVGRHHKTDNFSSGIIASLLKLPSFLKSEEKLIQDCMSLLKKVNLEHKAQQVASTLPYGEQRKLEIARALATEPCVLALDEPAAGMNPTERNSLTSLLNSLKKSGVSILIIEHDVKLVMEICDKIYVMDQGNLIAEGHPREVRTNPKVLDAYLGSNFK